MKNSYLYQIYYDEITQASRDPLFLPLDNAQNPRPDWREYWPIQTFLKSNTLDPHAYYGFFSPKFQQKTGLSGQTVIDFIENNTADVYLFSPFVEQAAFFLNVFEHGEANHSGLMNAMQELLGTLDITIDLRTVVCDFSNSIFSNYFVAKPAFWMQWLKIGEKLFAISEIGEGPFAMALNAATQYHEKVGGVGLKVFMMERLATLVLLFGQFSSKAYDPFAITRSGIAASKLDHEMHIANALKMAFLHTGDARYIHSFGQFRNKVLASL